MILWATMGPKSPKEWVQVCIEGTWDGYRDAAGQRRLQVTRQHLTEMRANFLADHMPDHERRLVIDYNHESERPHLSDGRAPAAGWIVELELRDGPSGRAELWGRPTWTAPAATAIEAGEYAYLSPAFVLASIDRVTGKPAGARIRSVALTNQPFLREMEPVAASETPPPPESPLLNALLLLFALPATAGEADVVAKCTELTEGRKRLAASLGLDVATATAADIEAALAAKSRAATVGEAVLTECKIAPELDGPAAIAALKPTLQHAGYVTATDHARVAGELQAVRVEQAVTEALRSGKVVPATEAWARQYALSDLAGFTAWSKVAPAVAPPAAERKPPPTTAAGAKVALTDLERQVCEQTGVTPETFATLKESA